MAQRLNATGPEAFLEYEGVKVYRTYRFDDPINYPPSAHLFTTAPDGAYAHDPFRLDVRNLVVPAAAAEQDALRSGDAPVVASVLQQAIDRGMVAIPGDDSGYRVIQTFQSSW
jgi:hypothetical protein